MYFDYYYLLSRRKYRERGLEETRAKEFLSLFCYLSVLHPNELPTPGWIFTLISRIVQENSLNILTSIYGDEGS